MKKILLILLLILSGCSQEQSDFVESYQAMFDYPYASYWFKPHREDDKFSFGLPTLIVYQDKESEAETYIETVGGVLHYADEYRLIYDDKPYVLRVNIPPTAYDDKLEYNLVEIADFELFKTDASDVIDKRIFDELIYEDNLKNIQTTEDGLTAEIKDFSPLGRFYSNFLAPDFFQESTITDEDIESVSVELNKEAETLHYINLNIKTLSDPVTTIFQVEINTKPEYFYKLSDLEKEGHQVNYPH